jgi:hypothetical protein
MISTSTNCATSSSAYVTTDIDCAVFLLTAGHPLQRCTPVGHICEFVFDAEASMAAQQYFTGAALPVREVFVNYRRLREVIRQTKNAGGLR